MKYAAIGLVAASVLALAGCSGTPADSPSGAPKPASTDVAIQLLQGQRSSKVYARRCSPRPGRHAPTFTGCTPHQRAMNSASTAVTCCIDSIDTHSSTPWMLAPRGP